MRHPSGAVASGSAGSADAATDRRQPAKTRKDIDDERQSGGPCAGAAGSTATWRPPPCASPIAGSLSERALQSAADNAARTSPRDPSAQLSDGPASTTAPHSRRRRAAPPHRRASKRKPAPERQCRQASSSGRWCRPQAKCFHERPGTAKMMVAAEPQRPPPRHSGQTGSPESRQVPCPPPTHTSCWWIWVATKAPCSPTRRSESRQALAHARTVPLEGAKSRSTKPLRRS